jgi:hypothetical protein
VLAQNANTGQARCAPAKPRLQPDPAQIRHVVSQKRRRFTLINKVFTTHLPQFVDMQKTHTTHVKMTLAIVVFGPYLPPIE